MLLGDDPYRGDTGDFLNKSFRSNAITLRAVRSSALKPENEIQIGKVGMQAGLWPKCVS